MPRWKILGNYNGNESSTIKKDIVVNKRSTSFSGYNSPPCKKRTYHRVVECPRISLEPKKRGNEIAVVACGCFWNPQHRMEKIMGVYRVVVGYTGGRHGAPTYKNMQDHTQALLIEYNPKIISHLQILAAWRDNDYPWEVPESVHYRSALFLTNKSIQHQRLVMDFLVRLARSKPTRTLHVDVEPAGSFYKAEEYQQHYMDKQAKAAEDAWIAWRSRKSRSGLFPIPE